MMRSLSCLLALLGLTLAAVAQEPAKIKWRSDYDAARKEAKDKSLPLLIDFMTKTCFWCDELDRKTFSDGAVIRSLNEKFIPLKVDAEVERGLANLLGIQAFPTVVMASPDGKILNTVQGFQDAAKFQDSLQRALAQVTPPDWMNKDLVLAEKWLAAGDYPRAIHALKIILEDGKGRPVQGEAQKLLADIEKKAEAALGKARELQEKGDSAKAIEAITAAMRDFPGLDATKEATTMLAKIAASGEARHGERVKRAQELLRQANDFYKNKEYIPCLDRCEILVAGFGDLAEGTQGALLVAEIKNNPEWLQQAADTMSERLGGVYLALADALLKRGQPDRAAFYLTRVVTAFPGSRLAESAQIRLDQLQVSGIRPTTGISAKAP